MKAIRPGPPSGLRDLLLRRPRRRAHDRALAGLPAEVDLASEFRYREAVPEEGTLTVAISQSGETADTLAAFDGGGDLAGPAPRPSAMSPAASPRAGRPTAFSTTHAGPEIGVASTKAFTSQLTALYLLALYLGGSRMEPHPRKVRRHLRELAHLPLQIGGVALELDECHGRAARRSSTARPTSSTSAGA